MSEESQKAIVDFFAQYKKGKEVSDALEIARIYAGSANANSDAIPYLIENLVNLFETGKTPAEN